MDEYYAMDESLLDEDDLDRRGNRKRRFGTIFLLLGFAAAAGALILTVMNYRDDIEAGKSALADLHRMEEMLGIDADGDGLIGDVPAEEYFRAHNIAEVERAARMGADSAGQAAGENAPVYAGEQAPASAGENAPASAGGNTPAYAGGNAPVYELHPEMTMPTVDADGHKYVGFLEIPAISRILPVMDTWSYPNLKISPCRFVGTVYAHDMIVCAHNYDRHFGLIKTLKEGDRVSFTDVYGDRFNYEVSEVTILQPTDVEEMKDPDDWDLTLFTCTIGGATRVTVRCVMKDSVPGTWTSSAKADLSERIAELQKQSESAS